MDEYKNCLFVDYCTFSPLAPLFGGVGVSSNAFVRVDAKNAGGGLLLVVVGVFGDLCCFPSLFCSSASFAIPLGSISLYSASVMSTARKIPFVARAPFGI